MWPRPPIRREGDLFALLLSPEERDALRDLPGELRRVVAKGDRNDPAVGRLFPAAAPDDEEVESAFRDLADAELTSSRLRAVELWESTIDSDSLTEEEALAWMGAVNDLRLVLGTSLGVTEESDERDFLGDERAEAGFELYRYLTWLQSAIVEAVSD